MPREKEAPRKSRGDVWKPAKIGDYLVATVEKIRTVQTQFDPAQIMLDLRTPKGLATIFCDKVLSDIEYKVGTTYKFKFLGWGSDHAAQQGKKNNRYRDWQVILMEK